MAPHDVSPLADAIGEVMGAGTVEGLTRLSGGASRETWRFCVGGDSFILQRVRPQRPGGLGAEPAVLRRAFDHGVMVPEMIVDGSASDALERPFMIVRAVRGETIARKIQRDDSFAVARRGLVAQMGRQLALIHRVPVEGIDGLTGEDQVASYRQVLTDSGQSHPVFEVAFRWLEANRPSTGAPRGLVHGDFRLGNVMVDADGLSCVLDWELSHIGDPMEDLGWLCVRAWRFGGAGPVAGLGTYEELFDAYESVSGTRPDARVVRWWEVLGTLKWGIMCIIQAQTHLSGASRSHELAAIGRRVCENEYDLLNLLGTSR
jgi:aminoglycoside phosphotransferase (APT) family kinase protein